MQSVNVGIDKFGRTDQQDGEDARVLVIELVEVKHRIGHDWFVTPRVEGVVESQNRSHPSARQIRVASGVINCHLAHQTAGTV